MTGKGKGSVRSFETEIEKSREESNWKKAIELAQQLKSRAPQHESLANFLTGEAKLELYLEEWPPSEANQRRAQIELNEAKTFLTLATNDSGKQAGVALDAHLLIGKLNYAIGEYKTALDHFSRAELNTLTEKDLPVRSIRIVAESYAIKGLCMECTEHGSSKFKQAEKEAEILKCFTLAADLTLVFLQKTNSQNIRAGLTLETALQRVPIIHMRAGRLNKAIDYYRDMLSSEESPSTGPLRLALARQLAEVLLRSGQVVGEEREVKPPPTSVWKPNTYKSINMFSPKNNIEEILLVLMIAEAMAAREAVLSQSLEFQDARNHSFENAVSIYDLLALACVRYGQSALLNESLERAMKFSFRAEHVWRQRALATSSLVTYQLNNCVTTQPGRIMNTSAMRAQAVAKETIKIVDQDVPLKIITVSNYYKLGQIEDGILLSKEALEVEKTEHSFMEARCYLYLGIGYQLRAKNCNVRSDRQTSNEKALSNFIKASQLDPNDHITFYYLALQYAFMELYNEAMDATRACLSAWCESECGLRLLSVLPKPNLRNMNLEAPLRAARAHYPNCIILATAHCMKAPPQEAWQAGRQFVKEACEEARQETALIQDSTHTISDHEHNGSVSITGYSNNEKTVKNDRRAPAWLLMARVCLRLGKVNEAADCVAEAANLTPLSYNVIFTRGLVEGARGDWESARASFVDSLALNPHHWDSMLQLGISLHKLGRFGASEGVLRAAAALRPTNPYVWSALAPAVRACEGSSGASGAADCSSVALQLRNRTPILSLHDLPDAYV